MNAARAIIGLLLVLMLMADVAMRLRLRSYLKGRGVKSSSALMGTPGYLEGVYQRSVPPGADEAMDGWVWLPPSTV